MNLQKCTYSYLSVNINCVCVHCWVNLHYNSIKMIKRECNYVAEWSRSHSTTGCHKNNHSFKKLMASNKSCVFHVIGDMNKIKFCVQNEEESYIEFPQKFFFQKV